MLSKTDGDFIILPMFQDDYCYNISIGKNFYSNYNLTVLDATKVTIGNDVLIISNVSIYTVFYPMNYKLKMPPIEYAKSVTIGDNI